MGFRALLCVLVSASSPLFRTGARASQLRYVYLPESSAVRTSGAPESAISRVEDACADTAAAFNCTDAFEVGALGRLGSDGTDESAAEAFGAGARVGSEIVLFETCNGVLHTERSMPEPNVALPTIVPLGGRVLLGIDNGTASSAPPLPPPPPYYMDFLRGCGRRNCARPAGLSGSDGRGADAGADAGARGGADPGSGVNVFVIVAGSVDDTHVNWEGRSRALVRADTGASWPDSVCLTWQGTHLAALINGAVHGVAPGARVVYAPISAGCRQPVWGRDYIRALQWVVTTRRGVVARHTTSPPPPAVLLTIPLASARRRDQVAVTIIEDLVRVLVDELGVTVVAAAGDSAADACSFSPARMPDVITVSALEIFADGHGAMLAVPWGQSNVGKCINAWAPGAYIESAQPTGHRDLAVYSGTAQAAALTAGVAARALSLDPAMPPSRVLAAITAKQDSMNSVMYTHPNTTHAVVQLR